MPYLSACICFDFIFNFGNACLSPIRPVRPSVRLSSFLSTRLFSLFAVRLSKHNLSLIILCVRTYTGCLQGFHSKLNIIVMTVPHTVAAHTHTHTHPCTRKLNYICILMPYMYSLSVCTRSHKLSVMQMHFLLAHEKVEQSVSV